MNKGAIYHGGSANNAGWGGGGTPFNPNNPGIISNWLSPRECMPDTHIDPVSHLPNHPESVCTLVQRNVESLDPTILYQEMFIEVPYTGTQPCIRWIIPIPARYKAGTNVKGKLYINIPAGGSGAVAQYYVSLANIHPKVHSPHAQSNLQAVNDAWNTWNIATQAAAPYGVFCNEILDDIWIRNAYQPALIEPNNLVYVRVQRNTVVPFESSIHHIIGMSIYWEIE
jgi:hypothetical protein